MEEFKEDLVLTEDTTFNESIKVNGNISGRYNLKVMGQIDCVDIDCRNINCWDIDCVNIDCGDINCRNIDCGDINCRNIDCGDINCGDINAYSFIVAYSSFKCNSWKCRRENGFAKCLDREIEIKQDKVCSKCSKLRRAKSIRVGKWK